MKRHMRYPTEPRMEPAPTAAEQFAAEVAPVIGAWRAYKATLRPVAFEQPYPQPTFQGFMDYLSRFVDRPPATTENQA